MACYLSRRSPNERGNDHLRVVIARAKMVMLTWDMVVVKDGEHHQGAENFSRMKIAVQSSGVDRG